MDNLKEYHCMACSKILTKYDIEIDTILDIEICPVCGTKLIHVYSEVEVNEIDLFNRGE